ncbi:MFS transporter [Agromyces luteolus]|uniref:MFS transporter n=1 Tax=Agromyces luteolus TaxID=88373 RepID=A0A7C9LFS2_9MICO|nr:MFS transporter [Agromyces luteolus]MUN05954.1 MFS transporter [Agromyces luteolus]GLK26508.1 MFS transporter [Agromyces luteolus]
MSPSDPQPEPPAPTAEPESGPPADAPAPEASAPEASASDAPPKASWVVVTALSSAQFVMVLDSTVMNVSISQVVEDLDTTVSAMQAAITFYTLTMAALMLVGAKLGDVWGRLRAFVIGAIIYAVGSLTTALSPNIAVLFTGWSVIEGVGAVLVIPAIAALIADNYEGRQRVTAFAMIGAASGAAVAAGPLIGGFLTTYASWRYVFIGEVVVMAIVVLFARRIADRHEPVRVRIDVLSVLLSSAGLIAVVLGMLQSKTWGWIIPLQSPEIGGVEIAPLGVSLTAWLVIAGVGLLAWFGLRQRRLIESGREPFLDVRLLRIGRLRSGLTSLGAQYAVTAGLFFMVPVYLQMTLGLDALETGLRIFPLSVSLILFSFAGTRLSTRWSPKRIVVIGQVVLAAAGVLLLASVDEELRQLAFSVGMFIAGAALGLLASQLGNVNMSSVGPEKSSEVGGMQGVFQNLGSSLGTALIGSMLISALATSFSGGVAASDLPGDVRTAVAEATSEGVELVPASTVAEIGTDAGLSDDDAAELTRVYGDAQLQALRVAFVGLIAIALLALLLSRRIPDEVEGRASPRAGRDGTEPGEPGEPEAPEEPEAPDEPEGTVPQEIEERP